MALVPWPTHGRRTSQKVDECRVRAREVVPDCLLPESTGCRLVVHGDDFTFAAWEDGIPKLLVRHEGQRYFGWRLQ